MPNNRSRLVMSEGFAEQHAIEARKSEHRSTQPLGDDEGRAIWGRDNSGMSAVSRSSWFFASSFSKRAPPCLRAPCGWPRERKSPSWVEDENGFGPATGEDIEKPVPGEAQSERCRSLGPRYPCAPALAFLGPHRESRLLQVATFAEIAGEQGQLGFPSLEHLHFPVPSKPIGPGK